MDVSYDDSEIAREMADETREFVEETVLPKERELLGQRDARESEDYRAEAEDLIDDLEAEAKDRGLFCPQLPEEWGGQGLAFDDLLPVFEQAGRSPLSQVAMHVSAPDEGNMHILEMAGTEDQQERWLRPLVEREITSGFSMTEPLAGAGSDPKMVKTTAEKDGDEWVINGHKWWTTGGVDADILIVVARTDMDSHPYTGTTLFLVPADTPGVEVVRDVPHMGQTGSSHAEITYDDVRVPDENILGSENAGFMVAQQRLGPARLTHCMRFTGMADRALDIAKAYMHEREAFGDKLAEKQALRFEVAEAEMRLHAVRTMVRHAARQIAAGEQARAEVHMCKVFAAGVCQDVIDAALQICGGNGIGKDLPLADFYEAVRVFRIVDGADEVHKRSIARRALAEDAIEPAEIEYITRFRD